MNKEQLAIYQQRFRFLHTLLEPPTRIMSRWEIERLENIAKVGNGAIAYSPHWSAIDLTEILLATNKYMIPIYKRQDSYSLGILGTQLAEHLGGIETKKDIKTSDYKSFHKKIFDAWDANQWVFIHPEGDKNHRQPLISKPVFDLTKYIRRYENRNKRLGTAKPKVAVVPIGIEYIESPVKMPLWPITTPLPFATRTIVRIGEPIYPSQHPEMEMDDYMRIIANLSNRPYGPDLLENQCRN